MTEPQPPYPPNLPQQPHPHAQQPMAAPGPGGFPPAAPYGFGGQTPAKPRRNIVGIVALVIAGLGFLFACIPGALMLGWILLPVGFILGIVAVCLSGKVKWQGLTAIIVAVVGTIVGFIVFFSLAAAAVSDAVNDAVSDGEVVVGEPSEPANAPAEGEESEAPTAEAGTRESPLAFATPIANDEWDVTLTAFNPNGNADVAAGNQFNTVPAEGEVYVILDVSATYKGAGEGSTTAVQIDYVTSDGTVISTWDSLVSGIEPQFGRATLLADATDAGRAVFLVPAALDGLIRVKPGYFTDDEIFFALP